MRAETRDLGSTRVKLSQAFLVRAEPSKKLDSKLEIQPELSAGTLLSRVELARFFFVPITHRQLHAAGFFFTSRPDTPKMGLGPSLKLGQLGLFLGLATSSPRQRVKLTSLLPTPFKVLRSDHFRWVTYEPIFSKHTISLNNLKPIKAICYSIILCF